MSIRYSKVWNSSTGGNKRTGGKFYQNNKHTGWNKNTGGKKCKIHISHMHKFKW